MSENMVEVKLLILPLMVGRNFTDKVAFKLDHEFLGLSRYSEKKGKRRSLLSKENSGYRQCDEPTGIWEIQWCMSIKCGEQSSWKEAKGLVDQTEVCLLFCLGGAIGCPKIRLGF